DIVDQGIARIELKGTDRTALSNPVPRTAADKVHGIKLYRANMLPRLTQPSPRSTAIDVQVIAPESDAFVSTRLATEVPAPYVEKLSVHRIAGSHWVISEQPDRIAALISDHVAANVSGAISG